MGHSTDYFHSDHLHTFFSHVQTCHVAQVGLGLVDEFLGKEGLAYLDVNSPVVDFDLRQSLDNPPEGLGQGFLAEELSREGVSLKDFFVVDSHGDEADI